MTPLLTMDEVASMLSVTKARAYELARQRLIPAVRLGRQWRVDPHRLQEFVATGGCSLPGGWRREPL
jgi:excisionase family DNA binding protein